MLPLVSFLFFTLNYRFVVSPVQLSARFTVSVVSVFCILVRCDFAKSLLARKAVIGGVVDRTCARTCSSATKSFEFGCEREFIWSSSETMHVCENNGFVRVNERIGAATSRDKLRPPEPVT